MRWTSLGLAAALLAASGACDLVAVGPLDVRAVSPTVGSVAGGTRVTIDGAGFTADAAVTIGDFACGAVTVESSERLSCMTGASAYAEGVQDVVVTRGAGVRATLPAAFRYECPWTTSTGRRSCGAAPAGRVMPQTVAAYVTQFQDDHGFIAAPDGVGASNLANTSDFALGDRSAYIETDGAGTSRTLTRMGMAPIDMTGHVIKLWLKVDHVKSAAAIELLLGDAGLANHYRFRLRSPQGQQWMTDGDWVSFTVSWSPDNYTVIGSPDRAAITDIRFRVVDDAAGARVRLHVNGIALVAEPAMRFPQGVVSFTFDDNHDDMVVHGAPALARHGFQATAYVIMDVVDQPARTTTAELRALHDAGWDIAVHSFSGSNHNARLPTLPANVVEDDLVDARAWLMERGFSGHDHCAYPGGDFTNGGIDILPIVERYFASCRTVYQRQREVYPPSDPRKLRVFYVTNGTSLAEARAAVDHAQAHREWIILVFHRLVEGTPARSTEWNQTDYAALVDHVAASGMPVETVSQVLASER